MTDQVPKTDAGSRRFPLDTEAGRLAAWVYLAALGGLADQTAMADQLRAADPGPVTVEIIPEMDDTRASWIKPQGEEPEPNPWLAQLPADRAALFHLCSKVMDEILAEAVANSPRDFDGDYRAACGTYDHVSAPARDRWYLEIQWDDPLKRETGLAQFDSLEAAEEALAAVSSSEDRVLLVYGQIVKLSEAGGRLAIRHHHTDAYEGESCATCHYPKEWHQTEVAS